MSWYCCQAIVNRRRKWLNPHIPFFLKKRQPVFYPRLFCLLLFFVIAKDYSSKLSSRRHPTSVLIRSRGNIHLTAQLFQKMSTLLHSTNFAFGEHNLILLVKNKIKWISLKFPEPSTDFFYSCQFSVLLCDLFISCFDLFGPQHVLKVYRYVLLLVVWFEWHF